MSDTDDDRAVRPMNTGGLLVDGFIGALNDALGTDATRAALGDLIGEHAGDLRAILAALADQEIPGHIDHVLGELEPLWPALIALGTSFAAGQVESICIVADADAAQPVMIGLADGAVTLTVRQP